MKLNSSVLVPMMLTALFGLNTCETGEERAERHYQSSLELVEQGDPIRAIVELRNVFQLVPDHQEARETLARIELERGNLAAAYGQFLRVVEQQPDHLEGLRVLSRLAVISQNWEEAERHGRAAYALDPEDETIKAVNAALDYRVAVLNEDTGARHAAFDTAQLILAAGHDNQIARQVVIDQLIADGKLVEALDELDRALETEPENQPFHELKLRVLNTLGDTAGVGAHLREMHNRFPENARISRTLIAWYVQQGDLAAAEEFLRQLAEQGEGAEADQGYVNVVQFLRQTQGQEAARAELDRLVESGRNPVLFKGLRALLDYETGDRAGAQTELEALLADAEPSDQVNSLKVTLARIREEDGNNVGARALVEDVLAADGTNVEALQMRAQWLIEDDKPREAINTLRTALDQAPRDVTTLTLMAEAHLRDGSRDLAGERLSLAVEASNQGVAESLRYAQFLLQRDRFITAENVLINALRQASGNQQLLELLGQLYLDQGDFGRAEGVIENLERQNDVQASSIANALRSTLLQRQNRTDENIAFLQGLIEEGSSGIAASNAIVQTHLRAGKADQAAAYLDGELAKTPEQPVLRYLRATVHGVQGEVAEAEAIYRDLITEVPSAQAPAQALYVLLLRDGRPDAASQVLEAAIEATGGAPELLWMRAGELEKAKDFDGAIAIYEELYAQDTNNAIVANNLASLITTHRDDPESLERAFAIARRLRGAEQPAFQDTYGWIAYRRGDMKEALAHLEPAAQGLPNDPLVQYHLGMTYVALEEIEKARETLTRALEIAGDSPLPQFDTLRETLANLPAPE